MESFRILLLIFLVLCALFVSFSKNLLVSVVIFMSYSLIMSIIWVLLESPDLAITEAVKFTGEKLGIHMKLNEITCSRAHKNNQCIQNACPFYQNKKKKIAFICVHNSCRSQIAEALGKHLAADVFEFYSAGTETKPQINQDAVRIMKELYGIDMEKTQYSKLISDIPNPDVAISMGCNVGCPFIGRGFDDNWGLEDPTGKSDEEFKAVIKKIEENILTLRDKVTK